MAKPWKTTGRAYDRKLKGNVSVPISIEIDWNRIADLLANKAYSNKSGRSSLLHGAIVGTIITEKKS